VPERNGCKGDTPFPHSIFVAETKTLVETPKPHDLAMPLNKRPYSLTMDRIR